MTENLFVLGNGESRKDIDVELLKTKGKVYGCNAIYREHKIDGLIAVDPMLATGNSSVAAIDMLKNAGAKNILFLCLLAAPEGVARMKEAHPDVPIVTASLDRQLNEKGYIMPGLGDAGDRMFGTK